MVVGSGNIKLTGKTNGMTAQILITNEFNENISWNEGKTIRMYPGGTVNKLYLLTPETYRLRFNGGQESFVAVKNLGDQYHKYKGGSNGEKAIIK
jgi:hypothetical protein